MESRKDTIKYIIKTDNNRTYSLYIMEADEYKKGKFIGLFLYYDNGEDIDSTEDLWMKLRHRLLFENSIDSVKARVIEYGDGRNERYIFLEVQEPYLV
jgi:hypothetical protein